MQLNPINEHIGKHLSNNFLDEEGKKKFLPIVDFFRPVRLPKTEA